jgi:hypothetical protein
VDESYMIAEVHTLRQEANHEPKKCTHQIQELQSRLRTAERVARTAIACMKSDASTLAIMRDRGMDVSPRFRGSKSLRRPRQSFENFRRCS